MLHFLRRIRRSLIGTGATRKYLLYAIGEILLVMIGILLALQVNNWNENRKERIQEQAILKNLQSDLRDDIKEIIFQIEFKKDMIEGYTNCLDILTNIKKGSKAEFMESFKTILQVGGVSLNVTTFNNLQTTGEIRLLQNKTLADGIVKYYNTGYLGWETALRDYTRNITAPYLLNFDYIPQNKNESEFNNSIKLADDVYDYDKPAKPLSAYKSDYFIINTLRHKIWNLEGLIIQYNTLLTHAKSLDEEIQKTLEN